MRNSKRQGFTLVELIVVITILAILGTIAFISLQGYSADARNTKRSQNIDQLQTAMVTKQTSGVSLMSMITSVSGNTLTLPSIGGTGATTSEYTAGTANFAALGIKQADYQDPQSNKDYVIGATTKADGKFELSASMENGAGAKTARILGNYIARTNTTYNLGATGSVVSLSGATATLTNLKIGDTVNAAGVVATVLNVSPDGQSFTLDKITTTVNGTIALNASETGGLIKSTAGLSIGSIVSNNGTALAY